MVNIEKLNSSIEKLDIQSKEIDGIIQKQKKLDDLVMDIENLKIDIKRNFQSSLSISKEIDDLMNKSEGTALSVEGIINKKLIEIADTIEGYNSSIVGLSEGVNEINANLTNEVKEFRVSFISEVSKNRDNLINELKEFSSNFTNKLNESNLNLVHEVKELKVNLTKEVNESNENARNSNTSTLKTLNEFINENYKTVNELQNVLDVKNGLLKSELLLEFANVNKSISNLEKEIKEVKETEKELEKKIITSNDTVKNEVNSKFKMQQILSVITIILVAINIFINFVK